MLGVLSDEITQLAVDNRSARPATSGRRRVTDDLKTPLRLGVAQRTVGSMTEYSIMGYTEYLGSTTTYSLGVPWYLDTRLFWYSDTHIGGTQCTP